MLFTKVRFLGIITVLACISLSMQKQKATLYVIGDSTVRNGDGSGKNGQWGWGSFLDDYFDTTKINIRNRAIGGRSSRTFITEGRWDTVLAYLREGDFVIIQFGHNDAGPLDDTARARGTIKGTGEEAKEIYNPIRKEKEMVHTYGWYLRKYVRDTKARKAIPIICSPIPRNQWNGAKVKRASDDYGKWAQEIAAAEGVAFIDLNKLVADRYDMLGPDTVSGFFFGDHTHTNREGAILNAQAVITGVKSLQRVTLKDYVRRH